MFKSKKSNQQRSTVSPLDPPPASTSPYPRYETSTPSSSSSGHQQYTTYPQGQNHQSRNTGHGQPYPPTGQSGFGPGAGPGPSGGGRTYSDRDQYSPPGAYPDQGRRPSSEQFRRLPVSNQEYQGFQGPGSKDFDPDINPKPRSQVDIDEEKRRRRQSLPLSNIPQHIYNEDNPGRPTSAGPGDFKRSGSENMLRPGNNNRSPLPSQEDLERIRSSGTTGSTGTGGGKSSGKGEKRRSGFFGFGKKDKDKDKDKGNKSAESRNRSSFSVDRPNTMQAQPAANNRQDPSFARHTMSHMPNTTQDGRYPGPNGTSDRMSDRPRNVSSPQMSSQQGNDFEPSNSARYPKSQSMAFGNRPNAADVFPNRNEQQPPRDARGMPSSQSMPFSQYADRNTAQPPPQNKRGSGIPQNIGENLSGNAAGYGGLPPPDKSSPALDRTPKQSPRLPVVGSPGFASRAGEAWMKNFDTVVELISAQPQKTYVASPPELEMILARTSAGGQPKQGQPGSATNDWDSVWLQLSGISLSMWSMKETRAAAAKGEKVPPTYFNITDSSLELLAPLPPPPHRPKSHPHHFVFSLNTAGSNRLLFSCPSERDMAKWATGLRLAAWERARLEEIYTGHLLKMGGSEREPKSELVKGRMEGWVRVRVMGGTDWKRLWVVLSTPEYKDEEDEKKNKRRSFLGFGSKDEEVVQEPNTGTRMASFYTEPRTAKNKTSNVAVLTLTNVTQAYAVFPERLEVISQSNLMKVVGRINGELVTIEGRLRDSGWALIMPESPEQTGAATGPPNLLANMMKWVVGFHDVFGLYGRPEKYIWDMSNPKSLFFAYPQGPDRNRLFLDIDEAMRCDFRTSNLAAIRAAFVANVQNRLEGPSDEYRSEEDQPSSASTPRADGGLYRLPSLTFGDNQNGAKSEPETIQQSEPRSLTPITERTDIASRNPSQRTEKSNFLMGGSDAGSARHREVSKQSSQGSSRHGIAAEGEKLPPISDSTETFPHYPEGPQNTTILAGRKVTDPPAPVETPTSTVESRATDWSRSTGQTPHGQSPASRDDEDETTEVFHTPQPAGTATLPSSADRDLPDLPGSAAASPKRDQNPPRTIQTQAQGQNGPSSGPPLAPALPSPTQSRDTGVLSPSPRKGSVDPALSDEPAARYLMSMVETGHPRTANTEQATQPPPPGHTPLDPLSTSPGKQRPTIVTQFDGRPASGGSLGRRPSGARPPPPAKTASTVSSTGATLEATAEQPELTAEPAAMLTPSADKGLNPEMESGGRNDRIVSTSTMTDLGEDAANWMAYAEQPSPAKPSSIPTSQAPDSSKAVENGDEPFRSSFAPSKAAEERRAKAEQSAVEQQKAKMLPGAGKRTGNANKAPPGTWSDGSDEEEDDQEDEEEGEAPPTTKKPLSPAPAASQAAQQSQAQRVTSQTRALPAIPRPNGDRQSSSRQDSGVYGELPRDQRERYGSMSSMTGVTPPPGPGAAGPSSGGAGVQRPKSRSPGVPQPLPNPPQIYDQQQRPQSQYPSQQHQQQQSQQGPTPATKHNVWNANFSAEHGMDTNQSGKFIELEEPSAQLTKAFAPHGLLQAGMQDKQDRSAKKQEEFAREMGSSLINVPEKPPPPQTGLLGAVAQHEKERKNAGGIGATITDRERERRLAEDRQREIEKLQRQQMDHMRQFGGDPNQGGMGGMYGSQQFQGQSSPYGMNMGMMGMPQYGYNPYQGGYNPYAQQQAMMAAQMAYHQAMMSMGGPQQGGPNQPQHTGSQAGDHQYQAERPSSPASMGGRSHHSHGGGSPPPQMFGGGYPGFPHSPSGYGWNQPQPQSPWGGGSSPPPQMPGMMPGFGMPWMSGYGMPQSPYGMQPQYTGQGSMAGHGQSQEFLRPNSGEEDGGRNRVESMISTSSGGGGDVNEERGQRQHAN